jgi:uncharacterized protein YbjT (DUF2867 family)
MFVIAGATGHVGSVVANELLSKNQKVRVIVRSAEKRQRFSAKGAEVAVGTIDDQAFLANAFKGASGAFLLVPPDLSHPNIFEWQRQAADRMAAAVKANRVPHVVLLSSIGADLESGTGPIRGLHYFENVLRATGTNLTAIRAGYFQENVANSIDAVRTSGVFPNFAPSADVPIPMVATRDIGILAAESLLSPPKKSEIIDLTGPPYTNRQVAEKLGTAIGKKLQVVDIPQEGWVKAMTDAGIPSHIAESLAEMYRASAAGKLRPVGDRTVQGHTPIDAVLSTLVH